MRLPPLGKLIIHHNQHLVSNPDSNLDLNASERFRQVVLTVHQRLTCRALQGLNPAVCSEKAKHSFLKEHL